NICERGHFGWIYNCMINLFFDQKNQTIQERTKAIQALQENYTVPTIETYASFLLTERNQNNSLALKLAQMSKEELKYVITKIFRGEMPAKTEFAQCLVHPECPYPTRKTCLGCENIIPTDYVLISATEQIKTTMLNLYNSKTSRIREREFYYLKKLFILVNQAIVEKGKEYVDTFIDREQLKKLFIALTENNKGRETTIDKPKTISEIGRSLGVSVTETHTFNKKDLSKYKTLFKQYKLKKIIETKSFDDPHWIIVDFIGNRQNLYYDLDKYPNLNNALKCFILINISSDFTIKHIASLQSKLRNVIIVTKGFKKDKAEELEEYVQQSGYTNRFKTFVYTNNFLQFIEHQNKNEFDIKVSLQEMYNKNRELPNYE